MITNQEIFDRVARHLIKQGAPAKSEDGRCRYRDEDGLKCAVGALISPEQYDGSLEGRTINNWKVKAAVAASLGLPELTFDQVQLLGDLQQIHDDERRREVNPLIPWFSRALTRRNWKCALRRLANDYDLQINF